MCPPLTKQGEVILLDGSFPGRKHGIISYPKPKNKDHPRWQAEDNDGYSFIQGRGRHPFAQLYTWAVRRHPGMKLRMNWEESRRVAPKIRHLQHQPCVTVERRGRSPPQGPFTAGHCHTGRSFCLTVYRTERLGRSKSFKIPPPPALPLTSQPASSLRPCR